MKPILLDAVLTTNIGPIPKNNLVAYNEKGEPLLFIDALLNYDDLKILIDNNDGIISHILNKPLHWSPADRRDYLDYKDKVDVHIQDSEIHVTVSDKNSWNSKETEGGAQLKVNAAIELLEIHSNDLDVHITKREKDRWNNTYTREETSNLLQSSKTDTYWQDAVPTYDDLYTTYPNAEYGWICTVLANNVTYIYSAHIWDPNNTEGDGYSDMWITAFSNSVPMADADNNGQMSKWDYVKLSNMEANANNYIHPDNVNMRHVTDAEKKIWSNKASKDLATIFSPGLVSSSDKEKIDSVEKYANHYEHPDQHDPGIIAEDNMHRFVTDKQIVTWNDKPTGKLASEENDGQMSSGDFVKLFNIQPKANNYIHPLKHSSTDIAQDTNHRFVSDAKISFWDGKEDKLQSQYRADQALEQSKTYTDKIINKTIGLAPDILDTFEELANALGNDPDFAANVTISLSNKVNKPIYESHVTDYATHLTSSDRIKFNTMEVNANFYTHPDYHPADMISTTPNLRFISDAERTTWNSKANGDIASELLPGQMSPAMVRKLNAITTTGVITSDWAETDENSGSFIRHKPLAMPAHGGNSETVNSYTSNELVNSRKSSTVIIGHASAGFTDKDVDFLCDGLNDSLMITRAFDTINEGGGSVLFREGTYLITAPLRLNKDYATVRGSGGVTLECRFTAADPILRVDGLECHIEKLAFRSSAITKCTLLKISSFDCTIEKCTFNGNANYGIAMYGNKNTVTNNHIKVVGTGILCTSQLDNAVSGIGHNRIMDNDIIECALAINIESTVANVNRNNVVSNNIITDCYSGIKLTNELVSNNCMNNVITGNIIMRGTGLPSDYLYEQHTIRIERGEFNVVTGNVLRGRAAVDEGSNNIVANNVSV